jgi:hypothetical protein
MKVFAAALFVLITGIAVSAQSTTSTNCNVNGNNINCTSMTPVTPAPFVAPDFSEAGKNMGSAIGTLVAVHRAKKAAIEKDEVRITYCQQNPTETITTKLQGEITCDKALAEAKAYCTIHKKYAACKLLTVKP